MKAKIGTVEIAYEEIGVGPAVLFLHDCSDSGEMPREPFRALAESGYRVILTSLGGMGKAGGSFDAGYLAREAVALLNYLGIGRAVILGMGRGGHVLLEIVEKFPGRVAASSLVVGTAAAERIRRLLDREDLRSDLREGRLDELKTALLGALTDRRDLSAMEQLTAWIARVRGRSADRRARRTVVADMGVTPILESPNDRAGRASLVSGGWKGIRGLNAHLSALVDYLVPRDESLDEEDTLADQG